MNPKTKPYISGSEWYASRLAATRARMAARMWSRAAAARMNGLPGSSVCAPARGSRVSGI